MIAIRALGVGLEVSPVCPACDLLAAMDIARLIESALYLQQAGECRIYPAHELSALSMAADTGVTLGGPRISSSWLAKFASVTPFGVGRRDIELDYGRGMTTVTLVHSIAELKPIGLEGVRILGVALRCLHSQFEWRADLDPLGEVVTETARRPRCA